ncbi:hypothetical protein [Acinetobacter shaoyimingii]|uniref:Uncharacterized protein n=1 Tax=Acinetobacter shaoyimingii TaxID=2715164 RepID=A0A6G8RSL1_9GAMM|nr:hypothetical protein [Acinetobacter shaoyimingii]QIO04810.1 hypothetical protein G8E00_01930 [Acinetobacter shaoyimingii]
MKKLISGLLVGIIASTCAMTTMAAPSFAHDRHAQHQMDKKSVSHHQTHYKNDHRQAHSFYDRKHKPNHPKLNHSQNHNGFFKKNSHQDHNPKHRFIGQHH